MFDLRGSDMSIYSQPADGTGLPESITTAEEGTEHWPESWSPDGQTLSFAVVRPGDSGIWTFTADDGTAEVFTDVTGVQRGSAFSPDGNWLAYHSNEAGVFEVYAQPFPATGQVQRIAPQEGRNAPSWSSDGRRLFFPQTSLGL